MSARMPALVALLVLAAALAAVIVLTTPWQPLSGHAPGGRAVASWARDFTAAQHAREDAYHAAVRPPAYLSLGVGILVVLVLGFTSYGARLAGALARPLGGGWAWQAVLGSAAVLVLARVVTLPFDVWAQTVVKRYGLSTQGWGGWADDQLRGLAVALVPTVLVVLAFYALVHRWPRTWWAPAAAGAAAVVVVASFVYPLVVEPVFNKFTPLAAGELRSSLLALAREDGVPVKDVLVADASRRTTALNAYVSGFGSTRRIVLYDTLLHSATPEEVRLVVAHELGHAKRQDVLHGTLEGALGAAAGVCLLFLVLSSGSVLRHGGVTSAGDARSVALVIALVTVGSTLAGPLQNLVSRRIEARADVHALDLTRDPATFIASEKRLAVKNLSDLDPSPVVYALFATHPTSPERIAVARSWARMHAVPVP